MTQQTFDFIVIGGGSAGYAAARTAAAAGLSTCVVDGADELGGLCILRGCMPSKSLIESANRNLVIQRAEEFGLSATLGDANITAIRDRKRRYIQDFASYRQGQLGDGRFTLVRGYARFTDAHTLHVQLRDGGEQTLTFATACIATGSVARVPPMPGLSDAGYWTSDDVLDADALPRSFIVLGGGAIAVEMAHYLHALGREVHLVQRSAQLLSFLDDDAGQTVAAAFTARGIHVHTGTVVVDVKRSADGKAVTFRQGQIEQTVQADEILVAIGRVPATSRLGLDQAQIELKAGKVRVNELMQTSQPHIFAAGDVCSELDVVHIAIQQGEAAAKNAIALIRDQSLEARMDYRLKLFGTYCEPQVAGVGATERELREAGVPFIAASYPFNDHGKSMLMGIEHGFVKLIAHAETGELLGGLVAGPEATELIHEIVVAMHFKSTAHQLAMIPHYHPTLSEIWTYPAEEIADQVPL